MKNIKDGEKIGKSFRISETNTKKHPREIDVICKGSSIQSLFYMRILVFS